MYKTGGAPSLRYDGEISAWRPSDEVLFHQCDRCRIVAMVENVLTLNYVLDFCPLFRYCVFAKHRNGGINYDESTSGQAMPTLHQ